MTYSEFCAYYVENRGRVSAIVARNARDDAKARVMARQNAWRSDKPLCFRDIAEEMERAMEPKS